MSTYFEIGGRVVEVLETANDIALVTGRQGKKEHSLKKGILQETEKSLTQLEQSGKLTAAERDTLFEHWKKTSFHNLDEFSKLSRREQIYYIKNPHRFTIWGVTHTLEVIGMHYDYFLG